MKSIMPDPLAQSLFCPILIGRDAQLFALAELLEQARQGYGQIALISGEAGIGKSRLAAEMGERAATQGFHVVRGNCFETDRTLPYALVLDLLHSDPEEGKQPPDLLDWLSEPHNEKAGQGDESKHRWFGGWIKSLVTGHPQLIICEDLHWADDASLEFLGYLARQAPQRPLLLLLTYRPNETSPGLTRLLALLDRQRLASEIELQPLNEQETDLMVRALFQQAKPIRSDFLYTIHSLSEGNPFLIEEMLKSLIVAGDIFQREGTWERKPLSQLRIPRTVQAAVQGRSVHLSAEARRVLRLAAVAGRRFDFGLLQRITDAAEPVLIEHLRELIDAQLVNEESADTFTFRHALIRQAIYHELMQRERNELHRIIGAALEHLYPEPTDAQLADLAYHWYEAQQWEKTLAYAQRAGERAQQLDAPRAALIHFTRALEAAQQLNQVPNPQLLYGRAQAAERLGEFDTARADYEAALAVTRAGQASYAEWQSLLALGFLWTARSYQQANDYFQAALRLARQQGEPVTLARTLNRVGNWYLNADEPQTALAYHHEALALLRQADDQPAVAETLDLVGTAAYYSGDLAQAIVHYQMTIELCRAYKQQTTLVSALLLLGVASGPNYLHNTLGWPPPNRAEAERTVDEALSLCRTMQWRSREAFVLAYRAWRAGAYGEYEQAFGEAHRALTIAAENEFHLVAAQLALALLYLDVGATTEAQRAIEAAQAPAEQVGALLIRRFVDATHARILVAQARYQEAEALLKRTCPPETPMRTPPQRLLWLAWVELWLATRQPAQALEGVQALIAALPSQAGDFCIPALWLAAGEALLALRRFEEAAHYLQAARTTAADHEALPLLWRIDATLARLYRTQRRSLEAEHATAAVHATAEQLAAQLPDRSLRHALQQIVSTRLPEPKTPTPRQRLKQAAGGLTSRECEVAMLVAQGQSNLAIADILTVTERTVESHVSNILAKLGFTNRSQIAAWAVANRLYNIDP
jgi:DNA-binding NarL/FixJ family response regulator